MILKVQDQQQHFGGLVIKRKLVQIKSHLPAWISRQCAPWNFTDCSYQWNQEANSLEYSQQSLTQQTIPLITQILMATV